MNQQDTFTSGYCDRYSVTTGVTYIAPKPTGAVTVSRPGGAAFRPPTASSVTRTTRVVRVSSRTPKCASSSDGPRDDGRRHVELAARACESASVHHRHEDVDQVQAVHIVPRHVTVSWILR